MKNFVRYITIFLLCLLLPGESFTQIPNNSFENWSGSSPVGWTTNNIPGYLTPVTQSIVAHSGGYSARLEMMNSMLGLLQPVLNAGPLTVGIPVSQRHSTINFYYQYFPNSPSLNLTVSVGMLKGGQLIGVAVGSTKKSSASFTKLTASISYYNSQTPDAATIYITLIDSLFNPSGVGSYALIDDIYFDQLTDVAPENIKLNDFYLYQNYPNPFNPSTKIRYQIPLSPPLLKGEGAAGEFVTLKVYDVLGNEVATLVNEYKPTGIYDVEFSVGQQSSADISSGVYFYQLKSGDFIQTKKMMLLK